jgi:hypothetical protein
MSELVFGDTPPASAELSANVERCRQCSFELAEDQRYCVNCGTRRAAARVDYRSLLADDGAQPAVAPAPAPASAVPAAAAAGAETRAISPLGAAVALGLVLLAVLLGAVIGKGSADSSKPVMVGAPAATTPQSTQAAETPTTTQAAQPAPKASTGGGSSASAAKDSAVANSLTKSSGDAYSQKSTELKGLMATGN